MVFKQYQMSLAFRLYVYNWPKWKSVIGTYMPHFTYVACTQPCYDVEIYISLQSLAYFMVYTFTLSESIHSNCWICACDFCATPLHVQNAITSQRGYNNLCKLPSNCSQIIMIKTNLYIGVIVNSPVRNTRWRNKINYWRTILLANECVTNQDSTQVKLK